MDVPRMTAVPMTAVSMIAVPVIAVSILAVPMIAVSLLKHIQLPTVMHPSRLTLVRRTFKVERIIAETNNSRAPPVLHYKKKTQTHPRPRGPSVSLSALCLCLLTSSLSSEISLTTQKTQDTDRRSTYDASVPVLCIVALRVDKVSQSTQ